MRKTLLAAAALAPLWFLVSQSTARAATTISSSTSTPINTTTDGDITINSGVTLTAATTNTAAVTLNSSNAVTNSGTITSKDLNDVVGILVQGGNTGSVINAGTINLTESYTPSSPFKDGINAEPFASLTSSGRYGIELAGTSPFVGAITNSLSIEIQGNNSYGILLGAPLTGDLQDAGTITYIGANGAGILETGGISGNAIISGTISSLGKGSSAALFDGAISGRLSVYAALTSTDYGTSTRTAAGTTLESIEATPTLVDAATGSTLAVAGNVGQGIIIGSPPPYTNTSDTTTDQDGDGITDSVETTGSVTLYGGSYSPTTIAPAAALAIGGATAITIGNFVASTTTNENNNYGVIIEGNVEALGVYDNVSSTALQIGGYGGTVTVGGGLKIVGEVEASGYGGAYPIAVNIGSGASVPVINNLGTIAASVSPPNSTNTSYPAFDAAATGITIAAGATVGSLINSGTIQAVIVGDASDNISSEAIVDKSGSLSYVNNTGTISASVSPDAIGAVPVGYPVTLANGATATSGTVAFDLSNNTTGVTLIQQEPVETIVTTVVTASVPVVTVTTQALPAGNLAITTTVTATTTTTGNTTVETIVPISPSITGDIFLGNGPNVLSILAGTVAGAVSMGSGPTASVTIDNGAIYEGSLTYSGTSGAGLTINVNDGTYDNSSASTFKTASFAVGAQGLLYFGVDPANNKAAFYDVSGTATIASGGKLGLVFDSNASGAQTYTVLTAGSLTSAASGATLLGPVPYMFNASLTPNVAAGTITLAISPKTPAELGLNPSQSAALSSTYKAIALDPDVQTSFLDQYTKAGFLGVYNQILPDYAGGTFQAANAASLAIGRATSESNDIENPTGSKGAWVQELFIGVNQGAGQTDGFRGGGFGFVGGVETGGSGLGAFGVTAAIIDTTIADPHVPGDSQTAMSELELGGYWQGEFNGIVADARIGGGYTWMAGRREFIQVNDLGDITLDRKVKDNWNGYTATGRFGLAYKFSFNDHFFGGGWFLQPQAHLDTFFLYENAYNESEAQGGPALAMAISAVNGNESSGTASILFGRRLGTGIVFRPELELGIRDVFTGTAGDTTARYLSTGSSFVLTPADITGAAGIARFKLKASSEYYELGFEAGGEILTSRYQEGDMKFSVRVLF